MRRIALGLALLALTGCDRLGGRSRNEIAADAADFERGRLEHRIEHLENQMLDAALESQSTAHLRPQDHDFAPIDSGLGTLTVSIQNVTAYADGSRVRLQIGNPTAASIQRFNFHVSYGSDQYSGDGDRQHDFQFSERLSAGAWHNLNIDLAGMPPNRLGHISISRFQAVSISLSNR
jgi:hypothetical protein